MVVGPRQVAPVLPAVTAAPVEGGAAAVGSVRVVRHPRPSSVVLQAQVGEVWHRLEEDFHWKGIGMTHHLHKIDCPLDNVQDVK